MLFLNILNSNLFHEIDYIKNNSCHFTLQSAIITDKHFCFMKQTKYNA